MDTIEQNSQKALLELEQSISSAAASYSNVHRGAGYCSEITTQLYEKAKWIVLDFLNLNAKKYCVFFCTPEHSRRLRQKLKNEDYKIITSCEICLPVGLHALAIKTKAVPRGVPILKGGSTVKIVSSHSVMWADAPQKLEAGTPSAINAIAFAAALQICKKYKINSLKYIQQSEFLTPDLLHNDSLARYHGQELYIKVKNQLRGRALKVPVERGENSFTSLDNAASTPALLPVLDTALKALRILPSLSPEIIGEVKKILSDFFEIDLEKFEIIFTGNTTEAVNIAAQFIKAEYEQTSNLVILSSELEHNSNELPWRFIPGATLIRLPVDKEGFISHSELEEVLKNYNTEKKYGEKRIRVVAISGASNVLGTFNNIEAISKITHKYNSRLFVDGAQLTAHRSINIDYAGVDYFAFSGHKIYAPFGTGALIIRKEFVKADADELELIKSSGEENIVGIAAIGKAISIIQRIGIDTIEENEKKLIKKLLKSISEMQGLEFFGIKDWEIEKLYQRAGVISFCMKGIPHNQAAKYLSEKSAIGVRSGCFCAHILLRKLLKINAITFVLTKLAFKLTPRLARSFLPGLLRVSIGLQNDESDIDRLIGTLKEIIESKPTAVNRILAKYRSGSPFVNKSYASEKFRIFTENYVNKVYPNIETGI